MNNQTMSCWLFHWGHMPGLDWYTTLLGWQQWVLSSLSLAEPKELATISMSGTDTSTEGKELMGVCRNSELLAAAGDKPAWTCPSSLCQPYSSSSQRLSSRILLWALSPRVRTCAPKEPCSEDNALPFLISIQNPAKEPQADWPHIPT